MKSQAEWEERGYMAMFFQASLCLPDTVLVDSVDSETSAPSSLSREFLLSVAFPGRVR